MNRPSVNGRVKGAGGERELSGLIYECLGVRLERNLSQARGGGFDLQVAPGQTGPVASTLAGLAIECKRYSTVSPSMMANFWMQAVKQATVAGLVPCLAWRADRSPWAFTTPLHWIMPGTGESMELAYTVTFTLQSFVTAVRER
jgi:hypothetical protein